MRLVTKEANANTAVADGRRANRLCRVANKTALAAGGVKLPMVLQARNRTGVGECDSCSPTSLSVYSSSVTKGRRTLMKGEGEEISGGFRDGQDPLLLFPLDEQLLDCAVDDLRMPRGAAVQAEPVSKSNSPSRREPLEDMASGKAG